MRIEYFKALVNAEVNFELLTEREQVEMLLKLIKDHNLTYPENELFLMRCDDSEISLDW